MAYARRKPARRSARTVRRAAAPRRSYRTSGTSRRVAPRGRARTANSTVRVVIVHENANPVARPALGLMQAAKPRQPAFG